MLKVAIDIKEKNISIKKKKAISHKKSDRAPPSKIRALSNQSDPIPNPNQNITRCT